MGLAYGIGSVNNLDMPPRAELHIKMFGCFDITYKGKSIFLETSSSVKAIALLRFLLAQADKVFTAEAIAENVWPENEYLDEKKVIRTYIHRLRKILSQENYFKHDFTEQINILNIKGGYKAELAEDVILDVELFEKYKDVIMASSEEAAALEGYNQINRIYSGEFLEECRYDHWAIMFRNYYLRTFSALVCHVLAVLQANRNFPAMLDICEKSLKIYELDENINIYFLQAMVEMDQVANALQHYSFITSKMYMELSVTPSEKLREIYTRIKTCQKQEDAVSLLNTEGIDRQNLFHMLQDIVKTYMTEDKNKYSTAFMQVFKLNDIGEITSDGAPEYRNPEERAEIAASLKYALEYALRKNDMYMIDEDDCMAIAVLYDAKVDFFNNIQSRISNAFYSRYTGFQYKIKVKISPVITID